jgi:membrane-bound metal-dependent hydrolase YbcI (DUF457 family)
MPSKNTHQNIAAAAILSSQLVADVNGGNLMAMTFVNAAIAAMATNLPDLIEPAINSHHRQFFHSALFGCLVTAAGIKLYQWQPEEEWEDVLRQGLLVVCGAYVIHLLADSFTPRGLPLLGKV